MKYSLGPIKRVDVIGFKVTVTMAWVWSSCSCLGKPRHEMSLGITVRVWVRSLSASSAGILPVQSPFINGWLASWCVGSRCACMYSRFYKKTLDKWLLLERPRSNLSAAKWEAWYCSCCNNLSLFCRMVPQQITKLLKGCLGFLPF